MPAGGSPGAENDDLVYSGAGSDCDIDDEDQCVPAFETGSGNNIMLCILEKYLQIKHQILLLLCQI